MQNAYAVHKLVYRADDERASQWTGQKEDAAYGRLSVRECRKTKHGIKRKRVNIDFYIAMVWRACILISFFHSSKESERKALNSDGFCLVPLNPSGFCALSCLCNFFARICGLCCFLTFSFRLFCYAIRVWPSHECHAACLVVRWTVLLLDSIDFKLRALNQ